MIAALIVGAIAIFMNFMQMNVNQELEINSFSQAQWISAIHQVQDGQEILYEASVDIRMSLQSPHSNKAADKLIATGLGSLVQDGSRTLLVTHNHWGEVLTDRTVITIIDVDQKVLLILIGEDFQDLIITSDKGTLVLEAPQVLARLVPAAARVGTSNQVKPGDVVLVVYHQTGNRSKISLLEARVESLGEYKGLPVFVLRSLSGDPIVGGDSGGGIWLDGRLVGNMWATIAKPAANTNSAPKPTEMSYAALLP